MRAAAVEAALSEAFGPGNVAGSVPTVAVLTSRRPARQSRVLVGAAAAVAVLVAAVAVPLGLSHGGPVSAPSAIATTVPRSSTQHAATPSLSPPAALGTAAGTIRNLGPVTSAGELRTRLAPEFASLGPSKGASSGTVTDKGAPLTTGVAGPSNYTLNSSVPPAYAHCVTVAEGAGGAGHTLELVATATYDHTPALVVVVHATGASSTPASSNLAVVVARTGCRVLARTTL